MVEPASGRRKNPLKNSYLAIVSVVSPFKFGGSVFRSPADFTKIEPVPKLADFLERPNWVRSED